MKIVYCKTCNKEMTLKDEYQNFCPTCKNHVVELEQPTATETQTEDKPHIIVIITAILAILIVVALSLFGVIKILDYAMTKQRDMMKNESTTLTTHHSLIHNKDTKYESANTIPTVVNDSVQSILALSNAERIKVLHPDNEFLAQFTDEQIADIFDKYDYNDAEVYLLGLKPGRTISLEIPTDYDYNVLEHISHICENMSDIKISDDNFSIVGITRFDTRTVTIMIDIENMFEYENSDCIDAELEQHYEEISNSWLKLIDYVIMA